jgi:hypothetical protein
MGTRSLTHVHDDDGKTLVTIYRQFDGYPEGLGQEYADLFSGFMIVNGISGGEGDKAANGMGCLAAQLVAHMKKKIGNVYLYPPDSKDCGEEYVYHIRQGETATLPGPFPKAANSILLECFDTDGEGNETQKIFSGPPEKFAEALAERSKADT